MCYTSHVDIAEVPHLTAFLNERNYVPFLKSMRLSGLSYWCQFFWADGKKTCVIALEKMLLERKNDGSMCAWNLLYLRKK